MQNILKHPSINYADDIKSICQPLLQLKINHFSHVHITKDNLFSAMTNNPKYYEYYLNNKCYNFDFHMVNTSLFGRHIIWDAIELSGKIAIENDVAKQYDIDHLFTIVEKDNSGTHYYHFGSNILGNSINQIYISNINLLNVFISYFKENVYNNKHISAGYNFKFSLDVKSESYPLVGEFDDLNPEKIKSDFLNTIRPVSLDGVHHKTLSAREIEILTWLHHGKTSGEIALILQLAEVTVNKHIANIKNKTRCYTQFQLGEFFSRENF